MTKTQIAIFGGGIGALTAAFELTEQDPEETRYDITIYTLVGVWEANALSAETRGICARSNMASMSGPDSMTTHSTWCSGSTLVSSVRRTNGVANSTG